MSNITEFLHIVQAIVWSPPLMVFLLGTGLYFSFRLGFLQISKLPFALHLLFQKEKGVDDNKGFISLCQSLSATIGTGNVVGVAAAVKTGGAGALFWMIAAAFIVMSIKYAEGVVSILYRYVSKEGQILGGPMYYIEKGMKNKPLAKIFAALGVLTALFGVGIFAQVNAITASVNHTFGMPAADITVIIMAVVGVVLLRKLFFVAKAAEIAVPYITIFYVVGSVIIIVTNIKQLPLAVEEVFRSAFSTKSVGGGILGTSIMLSMRYGVARGLFTNEAGMGSSTIIEVQSQTNDCVRHGLVSMIGTFLDTVLLCSLTGLVIVMSGMAKEQVDGAVLACDAYNWGMNDIGMYIVTIGLIFFAFTTIIGWSYYGEQCMLYLFGEGSIIPYRVIFTALIALTPFLSFHFIWYLADILNAFIIIPNLIALWYLRKDIFFYSHKFFHKEQKVSSKKPEKEGSVL